MATRCYLSVFFRSSPICSSVLSLSSRPVLKRFCHAACLCMGKKTMLDFKKRGEGGCKPSLFTLCVYVVRLAALNPWGSINSALKYMLLQVTPSPKCSHACTGLQHLKRFQSLFVIFILGLFHRSFWFFRAWCICVFVSLRNIYIGVIYHYLIHLLGSRQEFLFGTRLGCRPEWVSYFKPTIKSHPIGSRFDLLRGRNVSFNALDYLRIIRKRVVFTGGSGSRVRFFEYNVLRRSKGR